MKAFEDFFMMDVPLMLKKLEHHNQPAWGRMNASEMLDHLRKGVDLSLRKIPIEVVTSDEDLPKYKAFLRSDKPFRPGSQKPAVYDEISAFEGNFEELKVNLMKSLVTMMAYFEKHPEHTAVHPNFGELNGEEWMLLHRKHIYHHFTQFGLT